VRILPMCKYPPMCYWLRLNEAGTQHNIWTVSLFDFEKENQSLDSKDRFRRLPQNGHLAHFYITYGVQYMWIQHEKKVHYIYIYLFKKHHKATECWIKMEHILFCETWKMSYERLTNYCSSFLCCLIWCETSSYYFVIIFLLITV